MHSLLVSYRNDSKAAWRELEEPIFGMIYYPMLQQILGANPANLFRSAIGPTTQASMGTPSRTILVLTSSKVMWTCRVCAHGAA